jgi:hypothetical protein
MSLDAWISMLTFFGVFMLMVWKLVFNPKLSAGRSFLGFIVASAWLFIPVIFAPARPHPAHHAIASCVEEPRP